MCSGDLVRSEGEKFTGSLEKNGKKAINNKNTKTATISNISL
jgi:hypothetical protein